MSFLKRLFSADYRAAVSAEAAGQLDQAAERYVLAGEHAEATRVHLARAERADSRTAEIAALRDALHWVGDDEKLRVRVQKDLGKALIARLRAEGVATARDKDKVREAATLLMAGGDYLAAGQAYESIEDGANAAVAYEKGGLVDRMEAVLSRDDERLGRERAVRHGYANYRVHMRIGDRDAAARDLRQCLEAAGQKKGEYRRLLDELESRLITGGLVVMRTRKGQQVAIFCGPRASLGRDNLCEMPLRAGGVSRRHAEITVGEKDAEVRYHLADAGSRNGTTIAGMAITGSVPLVGEGEFSVGEHCTIAYSVTGAPAMLALRVESGLGRGQKLLVAGPGETIDLSSEFDLAISVQINSGRPYLARTRDDVELRLGGEDIAQGAVQLIHGDLLAVDGVEVEIV